MNATLVEAIDLMEAPTARSEKAGHVVSRDVAILDHVSVELEVVLGEATTTVKKLFDLKEGDTLALDASLEEPVLLRVGGKIVGRGHLVAVGDNFGLRISEIA
ncbi:FliM/FliN family flagellar motor switch protein [Dyella ginsengisoli]|uniref:FliM/FliN family flagellar motor switch protein n=1 Tax=Dyella ginsengisoli TaxID=363848 RepID=UPI000345B979|nr:FliM/FliN family flagellar motor C-terminal domain-containing protein [Dyella ginsengisoli]